MRPRIEASAPMTVSAGLRRRCAGLMAWAHRLGQGDGAENHRQGERRQRHQDDREATRYPPSFEFLHQRRNR